MRIPVTITVNGDRLEDTVAPDRTLCEWLRYDRGLTGTKQGCDKGDCGACTVIADGRPILSCITLAASASGAEIRTVEGLADGPALSPVQDAFVRHGAAQCGFCTPGMLMSATALLGEVEHPTREEIRDALGGNLCRCTGYTKILDAIEDAAKGGNGDGR